MPTIHPRSEHSRVLSIRASYRPSCAVHIAISPLMGDGRLGAVHLDADEIRETIAALSSFLPAPASVIATNYLGHEFREGDRVVVESPIFDNGSGNTGAWDFVAPGTVGTVRGLDADGDIRVRTPGGEHLFISPDGLLRASHLDEVAADRTPAPKAAVFTPGTRVRLREGAHWKMTSGRIDVYINDAKPGALGVVAERPADYGHPSNVTVNFDDIETATTVVLPEFLDVVETTSETPAPLDLPALRALIREEIAAADAEARRSANPSRNTYFLGVETNAWDNDVSLPSLHSTPSTSTSTPAVGDVVTGYTDAVGVVEEIFERPRLEGDCRVKWTHGFGEVMTLGATLARLTVLSPLTTNPYDGTTVDPGTRLVVLDPTGAPYGAYYKGEIVTAEGRDGATVRCRGKGPQMYTTRFARLPR